MQIETQKVKTALLVFFLVTVFGISASIFAEESSLNNDNIFLDSDQDGLSDTEEETYGTDPKNQDSDGDGYSDGAEIKSGYNPLKPAPGDKISEDTSETSVAIDYNPSSGEANVTEELSAKLAAMASNGEAIPENVSLSDIDSIVDESIYEETTIEELPKVERADIKIKDQSYSKLSEEKRKQKIKEDEEEYTSTILYILSNNLPHNISEEEGFSKFSQDIYRRIGGVLTSPDEIKYFEDLAGKGEIILEQMSETEVPENMIDNHIEAMEIAQYAISLKNTVKIDMSDPVGSLISLSGVESFMVMTSDFIERMEKESSKSEEENIDSIATAEPDEVVTSSEEKDDESLEDKTE